LFVATWFVMQYKSTNNNFMLSFVLLCKLGIRVHNLQTCIHWD
jgi:hypothetical protein